MMLAQDQKFAVIENLLRQECSLYKDYLVLVEEEQGLLKDFDAEKLNALTAKRNKIFQAMRGAQQQRQAVMASIPGCEGEKLKSIILRHCKPQQAKSLLKVRDELKGLAEQSTQQSRKYQRILDFAQKITHGVLSIFHSATQNVVKSYNKQGVTQKSYHPSGNSRHSNVIKQA